MTAEAKTGAVAAMNRVVFSSASNEWGTPRAVYDALNEEFGFTFDPCPLWDGGLVADGLLADWGHVSFCNPPYSDIATWVRKAWQEWRKGCTVVLLIPSRTDTRWWHDYVMTATEIRFIKGRLKFGDATTGAPFPSCIVVWKMAGAKPRESRIMLESGYSYKWPPHRVNGRGPGHTEGDPVTAGHIISKTVHVLHGRWGR